MKQPLPPKPTAADYDRIVGGDERWDRSADLKKKKDGHYHRCKECRKRLDIVCVEPTCAEGLRWVVLCLRCYEQMIEELEGM